MRLAFVECDEARLPAVRAFLGRAYSPSYRLAVDERLLRWQFGGIGTAGCCHLKLVVEGDEIRACLGYVPVELSVAGTVHRAAWTANWMVEPSHRRLGLGPLLLKQLMDEHDAVLSVGLDRDAIDILPRMGWTDFGDLARHVCVLDAAQAARLTDSGLPGLSEARPAAAATHRVMRGAPADHAASAWERVDVDVVGTRRSADYLTWRYHMHPVFRYETFHATSVDGRSAGYAAYRVEDVADLPVRVGRIVELVSAPAAVDDLLEALIAHARNVGVSMLDFFCSSRRLDAALHRAGFAADERIRAFPIVFQPIDRRRTGIRFMGFVAKLPESARAADWYVTKGDGDQDRPN